ncbi:MAG TPA: hypothetical protein VK507_11970, partial [Iamia sp.]|nr:hypothetical protein [Iamia sp.]
MTGMDSYMWTGYSCTTGSGRYVASVFGPAEMTNDETLRQRGALLAVVDLVEGDVEVSTERVALTRAALGCGAGDEVVALRRLGDDGASTAVFRVDPATGSSTAPVVVPAAVSHPTGIGTRILASAGATVVEVTAADPTAPVATAEAEIVDLRALPDGRLRLLEATDETVTARDANPATGQLGAALARGAIGDLRLAEGRGVVRLVGTPTEVAAGAPLVRVDTGIDAVSLQGIATVELETVPGAAAAETEVVEVRAVNLRTRARGETTVVAIPVDVAHTDASIEGPSSPCAVPRNDTNTQVMQPSPEQVEWAVHKAVRGQLTGSRPSNWNRNGLPSYSPQGAGGFPRLGLGEDGRIPAQVVLGVLAQESNLWQAARGALPGVAGNPLIGNYYGTILSSNGQIIGADPEKADCGYGVGQITDGMTAEASSPTPNQKRMIATDYQVNIAM